VILPRTWRRNGWTEWHLAAGVVLTSLAVWATWSAWLDIWTIATRDPESSQVFLTPIVAGWLLWVRRERLRMCYPRGGSIGPILVAVGWLIASIGYSRAVQSFWHGGSLLIVVGCFLSVAGVDVLRRFLPVFLVLLFLIPVPGSIRDRIAHPLQTATAHATQVVGQILGMTIERRGNLLEYNGTEVGVAEACNGLRMVFTLLLVSFAFTFGTPLRTYVRVLFLLGSPLSAIVCNVIRLIPTVWVFGHYSADFAHTFHEVAGWVMVVVAFLLLMGILRLMRWALVPVKHYTLAYDY
jgi:exosortase